jgi:hypothetical protein
MSIVRATVFNLNGSVGEMERGICEIAGYQGKVDMRITAVERKLQAMDTQLTEINSSLKLILAR